MSEMVSKFAMWAECSTEAECTELIRHFDGLEMPLLSNRTISWSARRDTAAPNAVIVTTRGLCRSWVQTVQDALELTESGLRLYRHLKDGPSFRFARVAWEPWLIPMGDLPEFVNRGAGDHCQLAVECVVDEALYQRLGSPQCCYPFRDGYLWTRFYGEPYKPLYANDQQTLNQFCRSVFPEYFKY